MKPIVWFGSTDIADSEFYFHSRRWLDQVKFETESFLRGAFSFCFLFSSRLVLFFIFLLSLLSFLYNITS